MDGTYLDGKKNLMQPRISAENATLVKKIEDSILQRIALLQTAIARIKTTEDLNVLATQIENALHEEFTLISEDIRTLKPVQNWCREEPSYPKEVWLHIFSFLSDGSFLRIKQVCKLFKDLSEDASLSAKSYLILAKKFLRSLELTGSYNPPNSQDAEKVAIWSWANCLFEITKYAHQGGYLALFYESKKNVTRRGIPVLTVAQSHFYFLTQSLFFENFIKRECTLNNIEIFREIAEQYRHDFRVYFPVLCQIARLQAKNGNMEAAFQLCQKRQGIQFDVNGILCVIFSLEVQQKGSADATLELVFSKEDQKTIESIGESALLQLFATEILAKSQNYKVNKLQFIKDLCELAKKENKEGNKAKTKAILEYAEDLAIEELTDDDGDSSFYVVPVPCLCEIAKTYHSLKSEEVTDSLNQTRGHAHSLHDLLIIAQTEKQIVSTDKAESTLKEIEEKILAKPDSLLAKVFRCELSVETNVLEGKSCMTQILVKETMPFETFLSAILECEETLISEEEGVENYAYLNFLRYYVSHNQLAHAKAIFKLAVEKNQAYCKMVSELASALEKNKQREDARQLIEQMPTPLLRGVGALSIISPEGSLLIDEVFKRLSEYSSRPPSRFSSP